MARMTGMAGRDGVEELLLKQAAMIVHNIEMGERLVAAQPGHPAGRIIERSYERLAEVYAKLAADEAADVAAGFMRREDRRW